MNPKNSGLFDAFAREFRDGHRVRVRPARRRHSGFGASATEATAGRKGLDPNVGASSDMRRGFAWPDSPKSGAVAVSRAPGRVNLIGEHTDYNGGFVMPMAIDRSIAVAFRRRSDRAVRLYSVDFSGRSEFSLDGISKDGSAPWSNYVRGVADVMQKAGHALAGMDAVISGDVPRGAGLSSSAALEVACVQAFSHAAGLALEPIEVIKLAQRAENQFVGVMCGIMDQFASRLGQAGRALLLDCRSLDYELVPLDPGAVSVVVANTGVRHELGASAYNSRRAECESAARKLSGRDGATLRDVPPEAFARRKGELTPGERRRAEHVLSENARVLAAREALKRSDYGAFGGLMYESHGSLRDLFEVSCEELDAMVDAARESPGALGARMTGGGFGGCTVNLVEASRVGEFVESLKKGYRSKTAREAAVYVFEPAAGASIEKVG
jgi:galactokinase